MNFTRTLRNIKNIEWKKLPRSIHEKFQDLIAYLTYDKGWVWLEYLISLLATIEVELPLVFDSGYRSKCNSADKIWINPPQKEEGSFAQRTIPQDMIYCRDCHFMTYSKIARFFYGSQCDGYCYYLGKGDFSFIRPTSLLWDGCKECSINCEDDEICGEK